jgi:hypothetical protein
VAILGAPATLVAAEKPYLFDLLGDDAYRNAWNAMLAGETVPQWVKRYAATLEGPSSPSSEVMVGGEAYTLAWVCKAHDCGGNELYVLFAPGGAQAWGLLIAGGNERWLGGPNAAIQAAIKSGVQ